MADRKKRLRNAFLVLTCLLVIASLAGHYVADVTGIAWDASQQENVFQLGISTADSSLLHSGLVLTSAMMIVIPNLLLIRASHKDDSFKGWNPPSLFRPPIFF